MECREIILAASTAEPPPMIPCTPTLEYFALNLRLRGDMRRIFGDFRIESARESDVAQSGTLTSSMISRYFYLRRLKQRPDMIRGGKVPSCWYLSLHLHSGLSWKNGSRQVTWEGVADCSEASERKITTSRFVRDVHLLICSTSLSRKV